MLLLGVSTQTRLLGIGRLRFPHSIPHNSRDTFFKGEGGRRGIAHRDSQIESSLSFLSFLVPWQEFEAIRSSLVGGEPSGASIKDSFEDLSRLNRRGNRVCVNVTADHQLASPRPSSWVSRGSFDIYIYIYIPLNK